MVEKIIINGKVRALGNIVEEKKADDYLTDYFPLSRTTDTVDGTSMNVYSMPKVLFVDYGTTTSHNDSWSNWGSYLVNRTRLPTYTLITPQDPTIAAYQIKYINIYSNVNAIEFDAKQVGGATSDILFQLRGTNQSVQRQLSVDSFNSSTDVWYHYLFDFNNGLIINTTLNKTITFVPDDVISFFFSIPANSNHTIHYANFVIY